MADSTIGRYRIREKIAEGGMGTVYRAEDKRLHRTVALKVIRAAVLTDDLRTRFEREAQAAAALNHPGICPVFDFGEADGGLFLVMELQDGESLAQRIARGPLEIVEAVELAAQMADALAEAHSKGVVHRDIKPQNVMLGRRGTAKIVDFGLALVRGESRLTQQGGLLGTAAYMSPEQIEGRPVDGRSDLWSLGVVLFEMLTRSSPFSTEYELAAMYGILNETPRDLLELRPDAPPELERILSRALAKNPDERYQSAEELAQDLGLLIDNLGGRVGVGHDAYAGYSAPTEIVEQPPKEAAGTSRRPYLLAGVLGLGILLTGAVWRLGPWGPAARPSLPAVRHVAILPFQTVGVSADDQALAEGLVEMLTSKLTLVDELHGSLMIVPASEIRSQGVSSVSEARRIFNVNLAITGSLQSWNGDLELLANLVDAASLRQIDAISLTVDRDELPELRLSMVTRVAKSLEMEISPSLRTQMDEGETKKSNAYRSYLQGRGYLQRQDVEGNIDRAIESFQATVAADESYALAHSGLGEAYWEKAEKTNNQELAGLAIESARRGAELGPNLPECRVVLGELLSQSGQEEMAISELQAALKADAFNSRAHLALARVYRNTGRPQDAERENLRALELRPTDWSAHSQLGVFYYLLGRYPESANAFQRAADLTPDNDVNQKNLASVLLSMGRFDEAVAAVERSLAIEESARGYEALGEIRLHQGRCEDAVAAYERATEMQSTLNTAWGGLGEAHLCGTGFPDRARAALTRATQLGEERMKLAPRDFRTRARLARYWALLGDKDRVRKEIAEILSPDSQPPDIRLQMAVAWTLVGETSQALDLVGSVLEAGFPLRSLSENPTYEPLRGIEGFQEVAEPYATRDQPTETGR